MKKIIILIILILSNSNFAIANNTNIKFDVDISMNCKFERVIINNSEYNYETLLPDQVKRKDLKNLRFISKKPNSLEVKNLSKFINKTDLDLKIVNKDIILIRALDASKKYSESAVFTKKTGEFIHEITRNIEADDKEKEKDISFYSCEIKNENI
ncbi:hypothetical protein [Candidatus Pelagibacter sp.]|uniref:hypothetical protein n=1 Tax=Candidatus Pelagibacter sp. TaxID=2024849 RepID=UPI003F82FFE5